jgi:UDP-glucose 4-epimerase
MHILVTGGAGYIGSITTRTLIDAGHRCTVIDTLEKGHRWAVDDRARFIEGSVGDREAIAHALADVDCVMHLAGYIEVGESYRDPRRYFANNVDAPHVMLREMMRLGVDKLVFSSTAAVYGEPASTPITEGDPTIPINPYGESKLRFERLLDSYGDRITSVRFRYFNAAGALPDASLGEAHDPETHLIPRVIEAIIAHEESFALFGCDYPTVDGTCVRDYLHVSDIAAAHPAAIEALGRGEEGGVYNLGNGVGFSNREVVETCREITGSDIGINCAPPRTGDPALLVASAQSARERFGWNPRYPDIATIISHAYDWHRRTP